MAKCNLHLFWVLGIVGLLVGGLTTGLFQVMFDAIFQGQMILDSESYSYEVWHETPMPMYMKVYYFNVSNAAEIDANRGSVKPQLVEMGPYVFQEYHLKVNEKWNDDGTITYQQEKTWRYLPELSSGSLDDTVTMINIIALAAAEYARSQGDPFTVQMLSEMFTTIDAPLFLSYTVDEFTFKGIRDSILEASATFPDIIPLPIPFDRFGWFYQRNGSADYDGVFTMFTGATNLDLVGQIKEWNHLSTIPENIFEGDCGKLTGSAGEFFPPERKKTFVDYFTPDLCRTIRFTYEDQKTVQRVPGYKFALDAGMVDNTRDDNKCFNPNPDPHLSLYNGLLNISTCKFNAPAYVSYPHFYLADEKLLGHFEEGSLNPSKEKHQSYLTLEPMSGIPLEVAVRLQINALARPLEMVANEFGNITSIELLHGLQTTFYPMVWFEVATEIDDKMSLLVGLMVASPSIAMGIGAAAIITGAILCSISLFLFLRGRQASS